MLEKNLGRHLKYYDYEGCRYRVQNIGGVHLYFYPMRCKPGQRYVFCTYDDDCKFKFIDHTNMKTIKVIEDYPRDSFDNIFKELNKLNDAI